jgi:hypothetical protein
LERVEAECEPGRKLVARGQQHHRSVGRDFWHDGHLVVSPEDPCLDLEPIDHGLEGGKVDFSAGDERIADEGGLLLQLDGSLPSTRVCNDGVEPIGASDIVVPVGQELVREREGHRVGQLDEDRLAGGDRFGDVGRPGARPGGIGELARVLVCKVFQMRTFLGG